MTAHTTLVECRTLAGTSRFTTAVSLHAHSNRSHEVMTSVPAYLDRIPVIRGFARRELTGYARRNGHTADFSKGWWRPPLSPEVVVDSEAQQIALATGLRALVSLTDHDSIEACLELRSTAAWASVPISFEWTVPYDDTFFHLGVHNLRPASAGTTFDALMAFTTGRRRHDLAALLDGLGEDRELLLVLNHPLWDLAAVGDSRHTALLRAFLAEHGERVHAVEVNGYRSWSENVGAMRLAAARDMVVVSGGDRHGCAPNSLLNLTNATSFAEFAKEIREDRRSTILVMPEYRQSLVARKLGVAADAMRDSPTYPPGQQRWTDRIVYERNGVVGRLSEHWPTGGPWWVRSAVRLFRVGTSAPFLPLLLILVWLAGAAAPDRLAGTLDDDDPTSSTSSPYSEMAR